MPKRGNGARALWSALAGVALACLAASIGCSPGEADPEELASRLAQHREAIRRFEEPLAAPETRVIDHPAVSASSAERRPARLERSVIVSPDPARPETLLFLPGGIGVDPDHNLYVFDSGAARIQVFDVTGRSLHTIGDGRGGGPGQFGRAGEFTMSDERIYYGSRMDRLVAWNLDGTLVHMVQFKVFLDEMTATSNGLIGATWRASRAGLRRVQVIGTISEDGFATEFRYRPQYPRQMVVRGGYAAMVNMSGARPQLNLAVSPDGLGYVTVSDRYEVLAIDLATGEEQWVLHVDWPAAEFTSADREATLEAVREHVSNARASEVDWPSHFPRLASTAVRVDGHGRVYVYPFVKDPQPDVPYPVDIYDNTGAFLGAYLMPRIHWSTARDDYIYRTEEREDGEYEIVRYRIGL